MMEEERQEYKIFNKVEGNNGKLNDVIIFYQNVTAKYNVIYFGGDAQDYKDEMLKSPLSFDYAHWNLIETGEIIKSKFSSNDNTTSNLFIIRPDFLHLKSFANYSNFVNSNDFGVPLVESNLVKDDNLKDESSLVEKVQCWHHLMGLFYNASKLFNNESGFYKIDVSLPIIIVSFSKGCVVLNQLCSELIYLEKLLDSIKINQPENLKVFFNQIKHLFWLDGGHPGISGSWITNKAIIKEIKKLNWSCYVYVTPYQMKSQKRWAIEEYNKFLNLLAKYNVNMRNEYYFKEKEDDFDIDIHFEILKIFDSSLI